MAPYTMIHADRPKEWVQLPSAVLLQVYLWAWTIHNLGSFEMRLWSKILKVWSSKSTGTGIL